MWQQHRFPWDGQMDWWTPIAGDDSISAFSGLVRLPVVWRPQGEWPRVETLRGLAAGWLGTYATTAGKTTVGLLAGQHGVVVSSSILSNIDSVVADGNLFTLWRLRATSWPCYGDAAVPPALGRPVRLCVKRLIRSDAGAGTAPLSSSPSTTSGACNGTAQDADVVGEPHARAHLLARGWRRRDAN